MPIALTIDDLKRQAKRRVPKMFFDYADSGSWSESTYHANESDFSRIKLRQRVLVDMTERSLASTMIGEPVTMPVALAPTGMTGMQHADGEILAAEAAEAYGVPFTLSTMSICSIEDVALHTRRPFWFQLYVMKDRDFVNSLIDRAKAAHCSALVLTLDLQILGQRHKDLRNGLSAPQNSRRNISGRWQPGRSGASAWPIRGGVISAISSATPRTFPACLRSRPGRRNSSIEIVLERRRLDQTALGREIDPEGHSRCGGRPRRRR